MNEKGKLNIVATIEARMTSSRLPGKVLLPALGKPMLEHLVNRLKRVPSVRSIVLATTVNGTDDPLAEFAGRKEISCFRGSENDVMVRVIEAAESFGADVIVEITGDCPVIDPTIIEQTIQLFLHNECDIASNAFVRSYPDGMDTQVIKMKALKQSAVMTDNPLDREHVTLHMYSHPETFRQMHLIAPPDLLWPELGLTLDERDDYEFLKKIIEHFGEEKPFFSCGDIIQLLKTNPEWVEINKNVKRKGAA
jgi:spore coat polysaccharide biosynthesis protein SpsF